jgi:hypothetical protein
VQLTTAVLAALRHYLRDEHQSFCVHNQGGTAS